MATTPKTTREHKPPLLKWSTSSPPKTLPHHRFLFKLECQILLSSPSFISSSWSWEAPVLEIPRRRSYRWFNLISFESMGGCASRPKKPNSDLLPGDKSASYEQMIKAVGGDPTAEVNPLAFTVQEQICDPPKENWSLVMSPNLPHG